MTEFKIQLNIRRAVLKVKAFSQGMCCLMNQEKSPKSRCLHSQLPNSDFLIF